MWKKCFALALAGLTLLACAACGTAAPGPKPGPFQFARRILTHGDLSHDNEGAPVVEPGEVLVFFTYMESFDAGAAQAGATIYTAWAAEAVNHAASLEYTGEALRKSEANDGASVFTNEVDYGFGIAVSEAWMLPEEEYKAAYNALMAAARSTAAPDGTTAPDGAGGEKPFWLVHNLGRGYHSQSYDKGISFYIQSYLPERLQPNAVAVRMSTELMRMYFPFLGRE